MNVRMMGLGVPVAWWGDGFVPTVLVRNWWMLAVRGGLAGAFGLLLLGWPGLTLDRIVVAFGAYALLDGAWAVASALRASRGTLAGWPVALEGAASMGIGALALVWPFVPRHVVLLIAVWGLATGLLELAGAGLVPRERTARWLLATGGVSSIFLALLVLVLPYALREYVVWAMGAYALVFGVVLLVAAFESRRAPAPPAT